MPYITPERRREFDPILKVVKQVFADLPWYGEGDLNYLISSIIALDLREGGLNYDQINAWLGILEGVKAEFYRQVAVPYEKKKFKLNGKVY